MIEERMVDEIIEQYDFRESALIQILLEVQKRNQWLPRWVLVRVSERLGVPLARSLNIATFYKAFSLVPKGRVKINLCMGTACHVKGAAKILEKIEEVTGVGAGETDAQLKYSVETVNCIGCCALGPVVEIGGKITGKISTSSLAEVIEKNEWQDDAEA